MAINFTGSNLFTVLLLFAAGLVFIIKGGDWFVDAATWIAEAFGIPKFIVGATVVSFATTLPEMLVSVFAALEGNADIAVGNAVGSVTANTGLIMCLSLVCMPCLMTRKQFGFKASLLLATIVTVLAAKVNFGAFNAVVAFGIASVKAFNVFSSIVSTSLSFTSVALRSTSKPSNLTSTSG